MRQHSFTVNGKPKTVTVDDDTPLLYVLRDELGLNSPRYGCGLEQCGACRVQLDDDLVYACTMPVREVTGDVITVEGFSRQGEKLHRLQESFLALNAGQCGYCLSGILVTAQHLLTHNPAPTRSDVQIALEPHLCRCGAHNRIIDAIMTAANNG